MNKPSKYDTTQIGWEPVAPGGHRCVIKEVQETKSQSGKDMLIISFDMHQTDSQPFYYKNLYLSDQKAGKDAKWRGTGYLVTDESTEYGTRNLKAFNTAVEDSNPGFQIVWGNGYAAALKDKLIGVVFRLEEYIRDDHTLGTTVKPMRYCNFEKALEQKVPDRKCLPGNVPQQGPQGAPPSAWVNGQPVDSNGMWVPPVQQQAPPQYQQQAWNQQAQGGFMQADNLSDDGLPWN